jgi:hypothetical protein
MLSPDAKHNTVSPEQQAPGTDNKPCTGRPVVFGAVVPFPQYYHIEDGVREVSQTDPAGMTKVTNRSKGGVEVSEHHTLN